MQGKNLFHAAVPVIAMLLLGCGGANPESTAAPTPPLSAELRNATADFNHTLAWAKHYFGVGEGVQLEAEGIELVPGGPRALFLSNPTNSENGNPTHLVFQLWPRGFKYMGRLGYAAYRAVPVDALQQPRVVIYWQLTNDQGELRLYTLSDQGFELTSQVLIHPKEDRDGQLYNQIFSGMPVTQVLVAKTFPVATLSKPEGP